MCTQDVPPFTIAQGDRVRLYGLNMIGLRRGEMDREVIGVLKKAWRMLFVSDLPRRAAMARLEERFGEEPEVIELLEFLTTSRRGVCRAHSQRRSRAAPGSGKHRLEDFGGHF